MNFLKTFAVIFACIGATLSGMQPVQRPANQISALPNELQVAIAAQSGNSLIETCSNI